MTVEEASNAFEGTVAETFNSGISMQTYEASLHELLEEVRIELRRMNDGNNVLSAIGNMSFGPDGGGVPVISVQGEFVDTLRELVRGKHVLITPLSKFHYNALLEDQEKDAIGQAVVQPT